ncbi:glycosyltransferase [Psychromonas algicola]|uniref:glycosyltransferase n=1 Tax=Psychromonas algicola TaxID=2555642 RepID=UPI0010683A6A|nr:glycosyltransferase [Psychromonas sp. RZ5]TEW50707.1 glycosyltransferase [Psychromonas sp. RZ5]
MKVALLINSLSNGGAEKIVVELIESLYTEGVSVELICIEKDNFHKVHPNIKVTYLSNSTLKRNRIKSLLMTILLAFRLKKHIKLNNIELVQSHLFRSCYVNLTAKCLFKSSHVVQVVNHSIISRLKYEGIAGKVNLILIKLLYSFADLIISVSNVVKQDMENLFMFKNRSVVIYNPFDITKIKALAQEDIVEFNFNLNKKYIINVGRLIKIKRHSDLLYALVYLDENVEVLFVGCGPEREALQRLAIQLKIISRVHFLGWVSNPYKYIARADILVSTSESESFGNTIVEAFICDTAVISSACGGPSEIISKNCGILFPIGDVNSLVDSIRALLSDSDLKIKMHQQSKLRKNDFSLPIILKKYKNILLNLY